MQLFYRKKLLKNSYRLNSFILEARVRRGELERSELLPGAVDKDFFSQFTASLEFL